MSSKQKKPAQKTPVTQNDHKAIPQEKVAAGFVIRYPILLLALVAFAIYIPSLFMKFTELDDTIFIRNFANYNDDIHNLVTSFGRGLFDAVKDPYYRPLFLDAMILNFQVSGMEPFGYHFVNVLLHVTAVVLLYRLFLRLKIKEVHALVLSLLFAVHPVLSQAVAWIPGRNDTMLAIFVLAFLSACIDYSNSGRSKSLLLSAVWLLLAFFTKETAVFAAPAAFVLIVFALQKNWRDKHNIALYGVWIGCFVVWFTARSMTSIEAAGIGTQSFTDFIHRLPVIIQYTGKIFLPFNQSVFPIQEDTVYYYGVGAIVLLAAILWLNKDRNNRIIISGFAVFLLFLMPALLVPMKLNSQTFEHRLYLPMIGMLIVLSQSALFATKLSDKSVYITGVIICGVLAILNFMHQQNFSDPVTFWESAVKTSPNSAFANVMLGERLPKDQVARSESLFRKAYQLNPREKYVNFYLAEALQKKDSVLASEPYLLAEKEISGYYQCDFLLAYVAMKKNDLLSAISYLEQFLKNDPSNKSAENNLMLLYMDTHQMGKAQDQVRKMRQKGMEVPPVILKQLNM